MTVPQPIRLAVALAEAGVPIVVVGGAARWLRSASTVADPNDLDVLLPPTDDAIGALLAALVPYGCRSRTRRPRRGADLVDYEPWQLTTDPGPLDVFALRRPVEQHRVIGVDGAVLVAYR